MTTKNPKSVLYYILTTLLLLYYYTVITHYVETDKEGVMEKLLWRVLFIQIRGKEGESSWGVTLSNVAFASYG